MSVRWGSVEPHEVSCDRCAWTARLFSADPVEVKRSLRERLRLHAIYDCPHRYVSRLDR